MKISLSDKKKLQRRLPLWESTYYSVSLSEQKELLKKIENARHMLGMEKFLKTEEKIVHKVDRVKKEKPVEEKVKRHASEWNYTKVDLDKIIYLCNIKEYTDKQIARTLNICDSWLSTLKNRYMITKYSVRDLKKDKSKDYDRLTAEKFAELKNLGVTNRQIAIEYGMWECHVTYFGFNNVKKVYKMSPHASPKNKSLEVIGILLEELNKGKKIGDIAAEYGYEKKRLYILKQKNIIHRYEVINKNNKDLTPEKYIELKDKNMSDKEIAKDFGLHQNEITVFKKTYIKKEYFFA